jgi:hypothetical protein
MRGVLVFFFALISFYVRGQIGVSSMSKEEIVYLYNVKTIEDFINRFNDDSSSSLRQKLTELKLDGELTRAKSLKNCFNLENKNLKKDTVARDFVSYVLDKNNDCKLNFLDSNWYSKARCHFEYNGKDLEIPIVLSIRDYGIKGSKWMIVGIDDSYVFNTVAPPDSIIKKDKMLRKGINASSYAVNFLDLRRIFTPALNEKLCFDKNLIKTEKATKFINLIKEGKLKFDYASNLTFYFLQIPGYIVEVDEFDRNTNNSGWLINKVIASNDQSKETYKSKLLKKNTN